MKKISLLAISFGLALVVASACGEDPIPTVSATVSPTTFVSGSTVTVTVTTTDFEIRNPAGSGHQHLRAAQHEHDHDPDNSETHANAGHYHVYLDSTNVNPIGMGYESTLDVVVNADPGEHKLIIRLNDDSHAFLKPEVKTEVSITVQ